jgi:hypothetical protein
MSYDAVRLSNVVNGSVPIVGVTGATYMDEADHVVGGTIGWSVGSEFGGFSAGNSYTYSAYDLPNSASSGGYGDSLIAACAAGGCSN